MERNEIPSQCLFRDPKALQPARAAKNTRYIDPDTYDDLFETASGILQAMKGLPDQSAFNKLVDMSEKFVSILKEAKGGLLL